jgi:hypothetical protein
MARAGRMSFRGKHFRKRTASDGPHSQAGVDLREVIVTCEARKSSIHWEIFHDVLDFFQAFPTKWGCIGLLNESPALPKQPFGA